MKEPLKAGDRVRVYASEETWTGHVHKVLSNDQLSIACDDGRSVGVAHPKQCRRLKPRREQREWWAGTPKRGHLRPTLFGLELEGENLAGQDETVTIGKDGPWNWIRVREVLPKKKGTP